jgi:hypothetical protein
VVACHLAVSAYDGAPNLGGSPWPRLGLVLGFGHLGVPPLYLLHRPIQLTFEPLARHVATWIRRTAFHQAC